MSSKHAFQSNTLFARDFFPRACAGVTEHARTKEPEQRIGECYRRLSKKGKQEEIRDKDSLHNIEKTRARSTCVFISCSCFCADVSARRFDFARDAVLHFAFERDLCELDFLLVFIDGRLHFGFVFRRGVELRDYVSEKLSEVSAENGFE